MGQSPLNHAARARSTLLSLAATFTVLAYMRPTKQSTLTSALQSILFQARQKEAHEAQQFFRCTRIDQIFFHQNQKDV